MNFALTIIIIFFTGPAFATKYKDYPLSQRTSESPIIVSGVIESIKCLDKMNVAIAPGKKCSAPGTENQKHYLFKVSEVMKDTNSFFSQKTLPLTIDFKFTAMAHTKVPDDNYKSSIGLRRIAFLQEQGGRLLPIHEALYFEKPEQELQVLKHIYLVNKSPDLIGDFLFVRGSNHQSACFKLNAGALKALRSYDKCETDPENETSVGICRRNDGAQAVFFKNLDDCKVSLSL